MFNFNIRILLLFLNLFVFSLVNAQTTKEAEMVSVDEIKFLRKLNQNNQTLEFVREQELKIYSSLWENSKEENKIIIQKVFPKLYDFFEANSLFEAKLILKSTKRKKRIKESLISSYATGIKRPKLISLILQNQYSDLDFNVLQITGARFYNPLYFPNKYKFTKNLSKGDNQSLTTYTFEPKHQSKYLLNGYFHCNQSNKIEYFYASPSKSKNSIKSKLLFENEITDSTNYPKFSQAKVKYQSLNKKIGVIDITSQNKIYNIKIAKNKLRTSNIVLDFDSDSLINSDSSDNENINKTLDYFEALRNGRLGISKIDVLLKHLLSYNNVEGIRVGLGLGTNEKLSKRFDFGGYGAYGMLDEKIKYGVFTNVYLHKLTNTSFTGSYSNDLIEPGNVYFPFSKRIFYNEGFRKFGISLMDRVQRFDTKIKTALFSNIFVESRYTYRDHKTLYTYGFGPDSTSRFMNSEIGFGLRYNPDEKFFKMNNRLYSLGSKYPSLFLCYSTSVNVGSNKFYNYNRWDIKIEKNVRLMEYGVVDFQILGGIITNKNIPFPFLYNIKGSYKPGTPIINNTFGTMLYNEFVASKYAALFYLHNIGKIANQKNFAPELLLIHNMALGNSINTLQHNGLNSRSMEKGYFESGFYMKNLLSFQNVIGQTGFGMGFLFRYGPYAYTDQLDNLVFKFSLDIDI